MQLTTNYTMLYTWIRQLEVYIFHVNQSFPALIPASVPHPSHLGMLHLNITRPSGRSDRVSLPCSSKVGDLRVLAQKSFQNGFLSLITAEGRVLEDPQQSLEDVQLRDGDPLTAIWREARLTATRAAFALWCPGAERIVTWGSAGCGAESSEVDA